MARSGDGGGNAVGGGLREDEAAREHAEGGDSERRDNDEIWVWATQLET